MGVALVIARRSICSRRQVGAVIVDSRNFPVGAGYNGPPAGFKIGTSCQGICPRVSNKTPDYNNCIAIHAEANALLFAARSQYEGGTIYVTHLCCYGCAKLIANSGLARVVVRKYNTERDFAPAQYLLETSGLIVQGIEG